jgi:hypothetical protein
LCVTNLSELDHTPNLPSLNQLGLFSYDCFPMEPVLSGDYIIS